MCSKLFIVYISENLLPLPSPECSQIQDKFISTVEVIVKRQSSITVWVDQEWLSEKEMRDLGWSPPLARTFARVARQPVSIEYINATIYIYID